MSSTIALRFALPLAVVAAGVAWWSWPSAPDATPGATAPPQVQPSPTPASGSVRSPAEITSDAQPASDVAEEIPAAVGRPAASSVPEQTPASVAEAPIAPPAHPYVITPTDPNPRVQSILEAKRTGKFPERLTPLVAPKPFDAAAWERDPEAYLNVVEPGRVEQASQDPAAQAITTTEPPRIRHVPTGETLVLSVRAVPGAPVSWACTRGGLFTESKVGAVTVRADADGIARVTFFATPHAEGETTVLAASPFCAGQAEHILLIDPPLAQAASSQVSE